MPDGTQQQQQVEAYQPDGKGGFTRGFIPQNEVAQAITSGYRLKDGVVEAVHPTTGQTGIIPKEEWDAAQAQGYVASPREQARNFSRQAPNVPKETLTLPQGMGAPGVSLTADPYSPQMQAAQQSRKNLAMVTGGTVGGELVAPLAGAAEATAPAALKWLFPALTRASGVGLGTGGAELATTGKPREALQTAAATTGVGLGVEGTATAATEGAGKAYQAVKNLVTKASPAKVAELTELPKTEEALRQGVVKEEANSRDAFKSMYPKIDAAPVNVANTKNLAQQASKELGAVATVPKPVSRVAGIPDPAQNVLTSDDPATILQELSGFDNVPFRQAQQYRTSIEQYIAKNRPPANVYNALKKVSGSLTDGLKNTAEREGVLGQYTIAESMYQRHAADFWNKNAPLKPFLNLPENSTGATLNRLKNTAQQGRALEALDRRNIDTSGVRQLLSKGAKPLGRDIRDAATLKNLGQPALDQQTAAARLAALKKYGIKVGGGLAGVGGTISGLYGLYRRLSGGQSK